MLNRLWFIATFCSSTFVRFDKSSTRCGGGSVAHVNIDQVALENLREFSAAVRKYKFVSNDGAEKQQDERRKDIKSTI